MERYDCHCHIFNIVNVGIKAILEQLQMTESLITQGKSEGKTTVVKQLSVKNEKNFLERIKRIAELIRIFKNNSEKIFGMLDKHYKRKYTLFPLMFDGDYLLDDNSEEQLSYIKALIIEAGGEPGNRPKGLTKIRAVAKQFRAAGDKDGELVLSFLNELSGYIARDKVSGKFKSGFEKQIEQIEQLSKNPDYSERMVPFLGVDPRRENIKTYLNRVGKGKLFAGIKVYPPNGFSPCDKVLTGNGSVFEYCSNNKIPVISHCSYGGFATPVMSVYVNGMIIPDGKTKPEPFQGTYTFSKGLRDGYKEMVKERANVLNNPLIWEEVLKKYEDLILVLAHFGSGSITWQKNILRMMKKYPNLYTDVSCMSDVKTLSGVKTVYDNNPGIQNKILYGSDYFLDMFFNDSFNDYLKRMKKVFGPKMFDTISSVNPKKFMDIWYV